MNNAVYLQSGGPTSVINASFYGVIKAIKETNKIDNLYGSLYGIEGLINDELVLVDKELIEYEELMHLNGAILGTCRKCLKVKDEAFTSITNTINKYSIKYVFINGGNDSMDTADKLNDYFTSNKIDCLVVGIPKTIDNDLVLTDHCPGFGSNAKYVIRTVMEIALDTRSYRKGRVTVVEVMGRDTGWLTASSVYASKYGLGPDLIYVPESPFDIDKYLSDVKAIYEKKGNVLVCVAEALKDKNNEYISIDQKKDQFGHVQLGSVSKYLADIVKEKLNINTRNIELSLSQRSACHYQSKLDRTEAIKCGESAVLFALNGLKGMVSIKVNKRIPYDSYFDLVPLSKVANDVKYLDKDYIINGNYISDKFMEYIEPFVDEEELAIYSSNIFLNK